MPYTINGHALVIIIIIIIIIMIMIITIILITIIIKLIIMIIIIIIMIIKKRCQLARSGVVAFCILKCFGKKKKKMFEKKISEKINE